MLTELETIDDEADNLDITFVKIRDTRYAKKYGINKLPAMVYFRRRFPSIYRGQSNLLQPPKGAVFSECRIRQLYVVA